MIQKTSILAYANVLETLGDRQEEVFRAIRKLKSCNNLMISQECHLPINCITGRVNELRKFGVVIYHKKSVCPKTGKLTMFWKTRYDI